MDIDLERLREAVDSSRGYFLDESGGTAAVEDTELIYEAAQFLLDNADRLARNPITVDDETPSVTTPMLVAFLQTDMPKVVYEWMEDNLPRAMEAALQTADMMLVPLPEGHEYDVISQFGGEWSMQISARTDGVKKRIHHGSGPTPRAASMAAIAKIEGV